MSQKLRIWLLLTPALLVVAVLFLGGLLFGLLQSLNYLPFLGQYNINFLAYKGVFSSPAFWSSLGFTFWIALASTLISSLLALICALVLRRSGRIRQWLNVLFGLNLPIPHAVGAIMMLLLFSQSGLFSRFSYALGLTTNPAAFPALVQDQFGIGVILEYVWKETSFIGVNLLAALSSLELGIEEVAQTLGANRWQRLRHVILPAILPNLLSSSVLVLAFTFGAYEVPFLLASTSQTTLPVLAFKAYNDSDLNSRSSAMALGMIVAGITGVLVLLYSRLLRRIRT